MELINFDIKKKKYITKCPYGRSINNSPIMVGAYNCLFCKYFQRHIGTVDGLPTIVCKYAEDVANRSKRPKKQTSGKTTELIKFKCVACGHQKYYTFDEDKATSNKVTFLVECSGCEKEYKLEFTL